VKIYGFLFLFFCFGSKAAAQEAEFGKFTDQELLIEEVSFEPEAKYVVLYKSGDSYFKYGGIHTDYFYRYKVLTDESSDFGDFRISFYRGDNLFEQISQVKAQVSYLEGNSRKNIRLGNEAIKEVDLGDGYVEIRIAFPQVKKGSILEFSYKKVSKMLSLLDGWGFQGEYPSLYSSYRFKAPIFFQYQMIIQGRRLAEVTKVTERSNSYSWMLRDIPSLPIEPFVGSLMDYQERVDGYLFSSEYYKEEELESSEIFYSSWDQVATEILLIDDYRSYLYKTGPNSLLADLDFSDSTQAGLAKKIFDYVSTSYKTIGSRWLEPIYPLPRMVDLKRGNSFDKNLLLSYLFRMHGIESHLIMINERGKGRSQLIEKPYIFQFHSAILKAEIEGKPVFLDASDSIMPFGLVPVRKLVPRGFFMEKENGRLDELSIHHRSGTINQMIFEVDEEGKAFLKTTERYTDYAALKWDEKYSGLTQKLLKAQDRYKDFELIDFEVLNQIKEKRMLTVNYQEPVGSLEDKVIVLEPFTNSIFFKNIFTQNERILPIEFDYPTYESYTVTIPIPKGYELEDYPESGSITIPSKGVKFSFQISAESHEIKVNTRIELSQSLFPVAEYPDLKFILESIADKYSQPIILKKK